MEKNAGIFRPHIRFGNPQPGLPVPLEAWSESVQECLDACGLVRGSGGVWTTHLPRTRLYGVPRWLQGVSNVSKGGIFVPRLKENHVKPTWCCVNQWLTGVPRFPPLCNSELAKRGNEAEPFSARWLSWNGRICICSCCEKENVATPTCCNRVNLEIYYPSPPPRMQSPGRSKGIQAYQPWISRGVPGVGWVVLSHLPNKKHVFSVFSKRIQGLSKAYKCIMS